MRLLATTVVRESTRGKQTTGYIYDIDWDARSIRQSLPVPEPQFPESDDNPRGGVRGGRGIAATPAGIVVANYDTLLVYDDDWRILDSFSHPLFVGIHEIDWDGKSLWVAATGIDAVLRVSLERSVEVAWDPHAEQALAGKYGLRKREHPIDGSVDYRRREAPHLDQCHLNGVARVDGATVVNCGLIRRTKPLPIRTAKRVQARARTALGGDPRGRSDSRRNVGLSAVFRADDDGRTELLVDLGQHDFPTHNGQLLDARHLAVNDSTRNILRVFDLPEAQQQRTIAIDGSWLRGLEPLSASRVVVGTAPAGLVLVDLDEGRAVDRVQLSSDPNEAVHGLTRFPSDDAD